MAGVFLVPTLPPPPLPSAAAPSGVEVLEMTSERRRRAGAA